MDFTEQSPTILSLCPGIRGIERGLERVFRSVTTVAYVEIETFICENLLSAMETGLVDAAPVWTNIKTFNPEPFRGVVDGIIGGYPCQPFSMAGRRKGVEDPRHLFPYIELAIRTIRPLFCFFENVSGHLSLGFPEVSSRLRDLGYKVEADIYTAEEVGATQERERLFILAILEDPGVFGTRRWNNGNSQRSECQNKATGSVGTLADSNGKRSRRDNKGRFLGKTVGASEELGNTSSFDQCDDRYESRESKGEDRRSGFELANAGRAGLQGNEQGGLSGKDKQGSGLSGSATQCSPTHFPLGQGPDQHEWEEPRTIESRLGDTINGYNFESDLHRAIGNSVVEQTAELAFRDLMRKHFS